MITAVGMWTLTKAVESFVFDFPGKAVLAVAFASAGSLIIFFAVAMFAKARTTVNPTDPSKAQTLVTTGLYRVSRNPMYLAMAFLLAGWGMFLGSALNLLLLGGFIHAMNTLQIKPEETALEEIFGDAYLDYCRRTRRWI